MFTHISSPQCNHQHCPHAFPIYVVYDQFQLYIHPLRQCKEAVTTVLISSSVHTVSSKDVVPHVQTTSHHMGQGLESREDVPTPLCPNIAQICTLWSLWGVALSGSKMTPHSSSSDCLWWIAGLILSCKIVQQYWPLTIISTGMGWSSISTFQLNNLTCMTFRSPWLHCAMFFLGDVWAHLSAFCHFNWGLIEWIHDLSAIKMWLRNALPSFLQYSRWVMTRKTHMALWSSFHVWNSPCTNSPFHRLLVKIS